MPKLKTEKLQLKDSNGIEFKFDYIVYVDKDGGFSTTIPEKDAKILKDAGIPINSNRLGHIGYFHDSTLPGLKQQIKDVVNEFFSKETVYEKIIINYQISTSCHYCLDEETTGNIVPNGHYIKNKNHGDGCKWHEGSRGNSLTHYPYGIEIYVNPILKRLVRYVSGHEVIEFERLSDSDVEDKYYLEWLNSTVHMIKIDSEPMKEIDYDEDVAKFFVDLIKSICAINERIKDFTDPESIKVLAKNKQNLLSATNQ